MVPNSFRYQPFVAVPGNLGGKAPVVDDVLSSHEQEIYPTTSLDKNCKEYEFGTDRNHYVDLRDILGFETEICQGSWLRNLQYQRSKKGTERRSKSRRGRGGGGRRSSSFGYSCKQHFAPNFFQCWSLDQQSTNIQL